MILIIDDSSHLLDLAQTLSRKGLTIKWVNNMIDAVYLIRESPGYIAFDAIILDLDMCSDGLPEEAMKDAETIFTGWAYYKHILNVSPDLQRKTILFSAFSYELKQRITKQECDNLHIVDKGSKNALKDILTLLESFVEQ